MRTLYVFGQVNARDRSYQSTGRKVAEKDEGKVPAASGKRTIQVQLGQSMGVQTNSGN